MIVVLLEGFEQIASLTQVAELVFVQAFVAQAAIEAFVVAVLRGFAGINEAMVDLVLMGPAVERQPGELGAVVGEQLFGATAQFNQLVEHAGHPCAGQRGVRFDPQTFAGVVVHHGE